ncbi:MAG: DUF192 domain-containing protein [Rhizobiaceae bacterium]
MKDVFRVAIVAVALVAVTATLLVTNNSHAQLNEPMLLPPHAVPLVIETSGGTAEFTIEVADDEIERARGLMFRRDFPADRGMLFVFDNTAQRGFWMRNTPLPLDLLFISESGRVVAIRRGVPFSDSTISPIYPVRFVLELNEGTAAAKGIKIGARIRHPVVDAISGFRD